MKLYQYTILNQDGTTKVLEPCAKKHFKGDGGLYELLHASTIELIPSDYYPKGWRRCTVYGNEEARFDSSNVRNPHTKVLSDDLFDDEWDCVGDLVKEEVYKEKATIPSQQVRERL